jgi:hypothetical protein
MNLHIESFDADTYKYKSVTVKRKKTIGKKIINIYYRDVKESIDISASIGINNVLPALRIENDENWTIDYPALVYHIRNSFKSSYGITFESFFDKNNLSESLSYAHGQPSNRKKFKAIPKQSDEEYKKWWQQDLKVNEGFIREVYLENILTDKHLNKQMSDNLLFGEVIRKDPKMGIITAIYDDCYYWKVEPENVEYVRLQLKGKGIIIE